MNGGTPLFRLFGWFHGVTPPRLSSDTLTPLAALLLWLLLLPAFAFAFAFALLSSIADFGTNGETHVQIVRDEG